MLSKLIMPLLSYFKPLSRPPLLFYFIVGTSVFMFPLFSGCLLYPQHNGKQTLELMQLCTAFRKE